MDKGRYIKITSGRLNGYHHFLWWQVVTSSGEYQGYETIVSAPTTGYSVPFNFTVLNDVNLANALRINMASGGVTVGLATKKSDLMVNGNVLANKVKVTADSWPDYVFNPDFDLRPISDLAHYITVNKHLPDVPAAKEVETNGQDLGEMNKVLLKKIEEMSLYIIQLDKRTKELEEKLKKVQP